VSWEVARVRNLMLYLVMYADDVQTDFDRVCTVLCRWQIAVRTPEILM